MKFFLDTADIELIKPLIDTGLVDGLTTNPSLVAKTGKNFKTLLQEICEYVPGPVSAEVTATNWESMVEEGLYLSKIASNIVIKVPLTPDGLRACKNLSGQGIMVNVTLCFTPIQALLAAKADAAFVSPFVGRLDDIGQNGMDLIRDIRVIFDQYPHLKTEILVASVRTPQHVLDAALLGADVVTLPPDILWKLFKHPLTDSGLAAFLKDWEKTEQTILKK